MHEGMGGCEGPSQLLNPKPQQVIQSIKRLQRNTTT